MLAPLIFLMFAVIAGVYGFTGKALMAAAIAKVLFFVFLGLFALTFFAGVKKGAGKKERPRPESPGANPIDTARGFRQ